MAQNPSNVIPDQLIVVEGGKQLVPAPSSGDSGKVLGVLNSDGDIGWTEDREGMAQQQADWAETDPSKVTFIAHKPSGQMTPASTSSDSGKVLKVDAQGAPVWGDAPAGIVEFDWSTVTLSDIEGAIDAGKTPVMLDVQWDNSYTTKCYLQRIVPRGTGSDYYFGSTPEGYVDTPSTQSTSTTVLVMTYDGQKARNIRSVSAILSSSDGSVTMAQGASSSILDLSVANPLPASTSADEDKVLTVNSSGVPEWATAQGGGGGTTVGSDLKTVLHASAPVAKSLNQTFSGGTYPGETCFITSDDIPGTIAAIKVPKTRFQFQSSAPGLYDTTVQIELCKNGTHIAWLSSAKAKYYSGYYWLSFPEFWYIPNTPLSALGSGDRYQLILSYSSAGSYSSPSGGQAQFFPYSDTDRYIAPDCNFSGAIQPSTSNMPTVSLRIDTDKGINEKETLDNYGSPSYKLTINNTRHAYDWDNYQEPANLAADRMEILIPLQDDQFNDSGYQKKFPFARDFQKYGGPNHGTYDTLFSFNSSSPQGGDVYVVHIEAPATSTAASGDHVAFCVFTLCETVEDWEAGTNTQYYHNFALPGIYRGNHGGKFMADGIITISGSHSNGMFSAQLYSGELNIIPMESGVTITPSFGVDGWNFCVSKI